MAFQQAMVVMMSSKSLLVSGHSGENRRNLAYGHSKLDIIRSQQQEPFDQSSQAAGAGSNHEQSYHTRNPFLESDLISKILNKDGKRWVFLGHFQPIIPSWDGHQAMEYQKFWSLNLILNVHQ